MEINGTPPRLAYSSQLLQMKKDIARMKEYRILAISSRLSKYIEKSRMSLNGTRFVKFLQRDYFFSAKLYL